MKKFLFALLLGGLLVLALATVATADNGPHGSFTATTDACASCHRVHTAQYGSNSLLKTDPEALCMSCHSGGQGAGTNVSLGVYSAGGEGDVGNPLFGGGFTNALMSTAWSGRSSYDPSIVPTSRPVTSAHNMGATGTIWGSGANNSLNGVMDLECTSCHDPHGNAGYTAAGVKTRSYRLLRWQPQGSGGFTPPTGSVNWSGGYFPTSSGGVTTTSTATGWTVTDTFPTLGTEWYTLGTVNRFAVGDYNAGNANDAYNPTGHNYRAAAVNVAFFCAQCHDRYFNNSRLRNNTDVSMFCGSPVNGTTPPYTGSPLFLPFLPDADGVAPWLHPVDPVRCEPVTSTTTGALTGWGDNGPSGDLTYMYRHASGDIRLSSDGATAAGAGTSVSRSCVACHVSHGTAAQMTTLGLDDLTQDSALLRMDNRSVCLRCHASTVNFVVTP